MASLTFMQRRLEILFIATGFYKVGDYFRYRGFAERLVRLGHRVTILMGEPHFRLTSEREVINGVEYIYPPYAGGLKTIEKLSAYLPETKLPYDILYRVFFSLIHAHKYDVIHGFHIGFNAFLPFIASRRRRKPFALIYDWCDLWDNGIITPPKTGLIRKIDYHCTIPLEYLSIRYADGVTVNSRFLARRATEFGVARDRVAFIREGANSDQIQPIDRNLARRKLGLNPDLFLLGFSAFFNPDGEILVRTLAQLREKGHRDIKLLFRGTADPVFQRFVNRYAIADDIIQVGPMDMKKFGEYLGACDLMLLPFTDRPMNLGRWPGKLGDYLSAGKPVVAGGYGEVKELFKQHPEIGITCPGDADAFVDAILTLKNDPERMKRCEVKAREAAVTTLDWGEAALLLEDFYFRTCREKMSVC